MLEFRATPRLAGLPARETAPRDPYRAFPVAGGGIAAPSDDEADEEHGLFRASIR